MRRVALLVGVSLLLWACTGGASTTTAVTPTTAPLSSTVPSTVTTSSTSEATTLGPVLDLPEGLLCRDLAAMGYGYQAAARYWFWTGRPERMDADRNGVPCETVYPADQISAYWSLPTVGEIVGRIQVRDDEAFASLRDPPEGMLGPMKLSCEDPDRPVGYGDVFACIGSPQSDPDPRYAMDPEGMAFLVLDDVGHVASSSGTDHPYFTSELAQWYRREAKGMSCADLVEGGGWFGLNYFTAVLYWFLEDTPDRMDVDGNGKPCEDLYPKSEIDWVWSAGGSITTAERVNAWYHDWYGTSPAGTPECGVEVVEVGAVFACGGPVAEDCDAGQMVCEESGTVFYVIDPTGRAAWIAGTDVPGPTDDLLDVYASVPKGLFCRNLLSPEVDAFPFSSSGDNERLAFFWSLVYWSLEGKPARMDADGDGIPCETLFAPEVVESVLAGGPATADPEVSAAERVPGRWVTFKVGGPIWDVAVTPDGQLWAVGPNGALAGDPVGGWDKVQAGAVGSVEVGLDGVVWLSGKEGVVSFDGESWTSYPVSGWVQAVGGDGRVWVSVVGGVTVIDSGQVTVYGLDDALPDWNVTSLVETPDGTVYASVAGCQGSGDACDLRPFAPSVLRLVGTRWEPVEGVIDSMDVSRLLSPVPWLVVAPDGRLWARAEPWGADVPDVHLLSFDGESWAAHDARPEGAGHMVLNETAGVVDGSGIVWACTTRGELLRFDVSTGDSTATPDLGGSCFGLEADTARGVVWVGTENGLAMFDGETYPG